MKIDLLSFPHPVLSYSDDISGECGISEPNIETNEDSYLVSFSINHDNGTISDLVKAGKAVYSCEVRSAKSLYRNLFLSESGQFEFMIERNSLRGRVEFFVTCTVKVEIDAYVNPAAHADYAGFVFNLTKGDLLAYFGQFEFNADIIYHKLKAASSFMVILPQRGDEVYTDYIFDLSKVEIRLPKAVFEKYRADIIAKNKDVASIIHASFVQTALTAALFNYNRMKDSSDCLWAKSIQHRLITEPELNHGTDEFDHSTIPTLVQKLLGNPNQRLIEGIENLLINPDNE
jgi:hypothetical protein